MAMTYHKQLLHTQRELQHQGLLSLKVIRANEGNTKAAEIIRKIVRHELHNDDLAVVKSLRNPKGKPQLSKHDQYINQWKIINPVFHPQQQSSLKTIDVPYKDEDGNLTDDPDRASTWTTISDPIQIEEKLLARNIVHFGQAQGSLCTTQRLVRLFGYTGVTPETQDLLNHPLDETQYPDISHGATSLLNLLSNNNRLPQISPEISHNDFAKGFHKWSEGTSTSPSGRHLGHYRCLFADDRHEDYTEDDPDPRQKIMGVYHKVALAALEWGLAWIGGKIA
jgi:hypothetical protein